jgi:PEP-CTERM motif
MANSDFGGIGGAATGFPGSLTGSDLTGFTITMGLDSISNNGKTTTGNLGTITITIGPVAVCGPGEECFSTGTINIVSNNNVTLFQGTFTNGAFIQETCNTNASAVCIGISGWMTNGITVVDIEKPNSIALTPVILSSNTIISGTGVSAVPEPGTLGLVGTGLGSFVFGAIRRRNARRPPGSENGRPLVN